MLKRRNRSGDASYIRNARHRVDIIRAHWGNRAAANITRVDISRLLDTFGNRPATQRMVQATISAFFSFCEERYGIAHPCRHMKRRGGARERERFLSDDELRRALPVMRELGYPRGDVMLFSLLTGRRLREVTDMTWSEVDLVARVHHLPASRSKNRKAHTVPLSAGAVDVFKAAEGRKSRGQRIRVPRHPGPPHRRNSPCSRPGK